MWILGICKPTFLVKILPFYCILKNKIWKKYKIKKFLTADFLKFLLYILFTYCLNPLEKLDTFAKMVYIFNNYEISTGQNIGNLNIFWLYLIKAKFLVWPEHAFYLLWHLPFLRLFMLSPKICAKRVGVIKDKMCILKIQDILLLSSIGIKRQVPNEKEFSIQLITLALCFCSLIYSER